MSAGQEPTQEEHLSVSPLLEKLIALLGKISQKECLA